MTQEKTMPEYGNHRGYEILHNSELNKSTSFTPEEREKLGLRGLLPHHVCSPLCQHTCRLKNFILGDRNGHI